MMPTPCEKCAKLESENAALKADLDQLRAVITATRADTARLDRLDRWWRSPSPISDLVIWTISGKTTIRAAIDSRPD